MSERKRLAATLPEVVAILERHHEIELNEVTRKKLLSISAATIDRLLAPERRKWELRGRSGTKPGTLLKHQIPIRTFTEWNEKQAGFMEIDLVGHDGGDTGKFESKKSAPGWRHYGEKEVAPLCRKRNGYLTPKNDKSTLNSRHGQMLAPCLGTAAQKYSGVASEK